jgi:serine/threonine-protein kinase RsbW
METIEVPAKLESLARVLDFVSRNCQRSDVSPSHLPIVLAAVDEIFVNVAQHGEAPPGEGLTVWIEAVPESHSLTIRLRDNSKPFDPARQPPPTSISSSLAGRATGGLGIFLALQLVDEFHYSRENAQNVSSLSFSRHDR